MKSLFSIALLAATAIAEEQKTLNDKCYALALSGGGNNGAWEVGVLWGFAHYGNLDEFRYEVVTGVSAGSINTSFIAGYDIGDELQCSEDGADLWTNLHTSDVWKDWKLGKLSGALMEPGMLDDAPLLNFLQKMTSPFTSIKRRVVMSAVNADTGEYTDFTRDNIDVWELPHAAVSSASIPFVFPHHDWRLGTFMDGGTVINVNVASAIN